MAGIRFHTAKLPFHLVLLISSALTRSSSAWWMSPPRISKAHFPFGSAPTRLFLPRDFRSVSTIALAQETDDWQNVEEKRITEQERILLLQDNDDDDDEYQECSDKTFADFKEELRALAVLSNKEPDAARRAQAVFDEMYEAHIMDEDPSLWPNVTIYNLLIDAYAWSRIKKAGELAEHILDRMEDGTVQEIARPNVDTYIKVMEGWANRKQPVRAEQVFARLQKRFQLTQSDDLRVNTGAYNKLIKAWMKSGSQEASNKAEALLNEMLERYRDGDVAVRPNRKTWVQVMKTHGVQRTKDSSVDKIRELINRMEQLCEQGEKDFKPDVQCYNTLIRALGQNPVVQDGAAQAETVLNDMIEAYKAGDKYLLPNGATFLNVIQAFRASRDPSATARVEKLLEIQEHLHAGNGDDLKPDVRIYNAVMAVLARSNDPTKALKAKQLLDRMNTIHRDGNDKSAAPNLRSYNNVLNACAYTRGNPKELLAAFKVAVQVINELRESRDHSADPVSYGLFLRACAQLMPPSHKREAVVENVFRKCCRDGMVGSCVLYELNLSASKELCQKLLGGDLENGVQLPVEWSRNVKVERQKLV